MKKLNKTQKENIKKSIFKALHVIGYVSTSLLIILAIAVGVKSCKPKSQVQSYDQVSLVEKKSFKLVEDNQYNTNYLYNINDSGVININKGDVYYFDSSFFTFIDDSAELIFSSNCGVHIQRYVNGSLSSGQYYVATKFQLGLYSFNLWMPGASNYVNITYNSLVNSLFIFDTDCTVYTNNYPYNLFCFFNGALINVDNYKGAIYEQDSLDLNYSYYKNFIESYWLRGNQWFYYPYVLNINDLIAYSPSNYYFMPLLTSRNVPYYYCFSDSNRYDLYIGNDNSTGFLFFKGYSNYDNQVLGLIYQSDTSNPYSLDVTNYGFAFTTFCGCYTFHNLYKNFLKYSYYVGSRPTLASYESDYNVYLNLNVTFSTFNVYRTAEQGGSLTSGYGYEVFNSSIISYNGSSYTRFYTNYVGGYNPWQFTWWSSYGSYSDFGQNDPGFLGNLIKSSHARLRYLVTYSLDNVHNVNNYRSWFTLKSLYIPYVLDSSQSGTGSIDSIGLGSAFDLFTRAFDSIGNILSIQLFGAFTIGSLLFLPLIVVITLFIVGLFKR